MPFLPVGHKDCVANSERSTSAANTRRGAAMRRLTANQCIVLEALIKEVRETGMPPTHARLVELCPSVARGSIASTVSALIAKGFVAEPRYTNSPIKPLTDAFGGPVTKEGSGDTGGPGAEE